MARARNIKPGFYKNEDLAECSIWARYIFPGLWMLADREGRLEDRPKRIKGELLPFDGQDVEPLLVELEGRGFLVRYRNSDGSFIQISKFSTHQTPHYSEKASVIKGPISGNQPAIKGPQTRDDSWKGGGIKRGSQPPDSLNPDSLTVDSPNPDSPNPESRTNPSAARRAPAMGNGKAKGEAPTNPCWDGYSAAYTLRYGVAPTRNAKVNAMLAKLIDRIPAAEAPDIAAFYVRSNRGLYVSAKHCVDLLLRDAEGLRTEWATGRSGTDTEARQADRTAATGNAFAPLIAEARARELTEKTNAE